MTMKSAKRSNNKKIKVNINDLKPKKNARGGGVTRTGTKPSHGMSRDYSGNHNEALLDGVS